MNPELTPERLRKLILRLAQLAPGAAYTVTVIIAEDGELAYTITPLGKLEDQRKRDRQNRVTN